MRLNQVKAALIAAVFFGVYLLTISPFAQSPDGFEMVHAAVHGGVLHPSGMPLQTWINRAFVLISPFEPALTLSLVSVISAALCLFFLTLALQRLNVRKEVLVLTALVVGLHPVGWFLAITPEKYALMAALMAAYLWAAIRCRQSQKGFIVLSIIFALALAQHSAMIILLPSYLMLLFARPLKTNRFVVAGIASLGVGGLYLTLLAARSSTGWPDWGQLESVTDVWNHLVRSDYGVIQLHNSDKPQDMVSGLHSLAKFALGPSLVFLFIPKGFYFLFKESKFLSALLATIFVAGLAVLASAQLPADGSDIIYGYQERYQCLLLPLIGLIWGIGLDRLLHQVPQKWRTAFVALVAVSLSLVIWPSYKTNSTADTNIGQIYRDQLAREVPTEALFFSASDFVAFAGIQTAYGLRFPLKNLFGLSWYREKTAAQMDPRWKALKARLGPGPWSRDQILSSALQMGLKVTATEATSFLARQDLMSRAEQTGLAWTFAENQNSLYTAKILNHSLQLCEALGLINRPFPESGHYFLREFLQSFRFAYLGAADFLAERGWQEPSNQARALAGTLVPGQGPATWKSKCEEYSNTLKSALNQSP